MANFKYTRSAGIAANTPAKREAVEGKSVAAYEEIMRNSDGDRMFVTTFEHDGQLYIMKPGNNDDVIVDTATYEKLAVGPLPEGHPFHGKEILFPKADSEDDED